MKQEDKLKIYEKLLNEGMSSKDIIGHMIYYLNKKDVQRTSRMESIKKIFLN